MSQRIDMKLGMEFWMGHVAAAALYGGSVKTYARRHGISADALYYWRNKHKAKPPVSSVKPSAQFVAVQVAPKPDGIGASGLAPGACMLLFGTGMLLEMAAMPSADGWRDSHLPPKERANAPWLPHCPGLPVPRPD